MAHRGSKLILDGGVFSISSEDIAFPGEFNYGVNEPFLKAFVFSYVKFLCDSPFESTSPKPLKAKKKFLNTLLSEDLRSLIKRFSGLADMILSQDYVTGGEDSTVFIDAMKDTPIFWEYHHWYRDRSPVVLKYILSFLRFGKKLEYEDENLNTIAFRDWCQVEDRLRNLRFGTNDLQSLKNICSHILSPLHVDTLLPRFGSGKVADRGIKDVFDKLCSLSLHPRLRYAFTRGFTRTFGRSEEKGFRQRWWNAHSNADDTALLKFVPKDISKARSICMEPNAFMYLQQEVWRWMRQTIDSSLIGNYVFLADQTVSRRAAVHGSQYLSTDTIDLSSASDSVHIDLVKGIMPNDWLYYMLATRTSKVKTPDGSVRSVIKFAPMGSAVCFPTQCIVFTSICFYAYHAVMTGRTTGSYIVSPDDVADLLNSIFKVRTARTPFRREFEPPVVFGDDIAVDSRVTATVIDLLDRLGFQVNVGKSFTGSRSFRESCGVYAYQGHDVTPVLYRLPFFREGKWDASIYASIISGINNANSNGYHHLGSYWLSLLKDYGYSNPIPFVRDPDAFGVFTLNKHEVPERFKVWHADWQVFLERVQGIGPRKSKKSRPRNLDNYSMDQWWRSRIRDVSDFSETRSSRIRPQETRLVPTWARCE